MPSRITWVGVGLGALLCEKLSYEQIELGLVPLGALGLSVFLGWLGIVSGPLAAQAGVLDIAQFLAGSRGVWATTGIVLLAMGLGLSAVWIAVWGAYAFAKPACASRP